jgi:hypothetical protein
MKNLANPGQEIVINEYPSSVLKNIEIALHDFLQVLLCKKVKSITFLQYLTTFATLSKVTAILHFLVWCFYFLSNY